MITADLVDNPEAWYEQFKTLTHDDQFQFIEETFEYPISEDFPNGCPMADLLSELQSSVVPERYAALVEKIRQVVPDFHRQELYYLEPHVVRLALFRDDVVRLQKSIDYYLADPAGDVDKYLQVFRWCVLYQKTESAKTMAEAGFFPLRSSPKVISGAQRELSDFLLLEEYEALYNRVQQGEPKDLEPISQLQRRLYDDVDSDLEEITRPLFAETLGPVPDIDWSDDSDRNALRQELFWHFLRYAREHYHLTFSAAGLIWQNYAECLESRSEDIDPERYFTPSVDEIDRFVARYRTFLFYAGEMVATMIWGLPYLADFLRDVGWIGSAEHQYLAEVANTLKSSLIESDREVLWQYDFVHRWTPPTIEARDHFAEEAKLFADSVNMVRSYDRPTKTSELDGPMMDILRQFADAMAPMASNQVEPTSGGWPVAPKKTLPKPKSSHKKPRKRPRKRRRK